jgi:hypothetical protein
MVSIFDKDGGLVSYSFIASINFFILMYITKDGGHLYVRHLFIPCEHFRI